VALHVFSEIAKSLLIVMLLMSSVALPELVTVTVLAALVVPKLVGVVNGAQEAATLESSQ
jgi:hypothetical protein